METTSPTPGCTPEVEPETEAYLALLRAQCRLQSAVTKRLKEHEITPQQYAVLRMLYFAEGPLAGQELCERLANPGSDVTRLIDSMVKLRWVRRFRQPEDRRVVLVELTDRARTLVERVRPELLELFKKSFSAFGADDLEQFGRLLRGIRH